MNANLIRISNNLAFLALFLGMVHCALAAEEGVEATITFCDGQKTVVRDFRVVYSWREMPANAEGLTPYKNQTRAEAGLWVPNRDQAVPAFKLIPFGELDSIEFESAIQQLADSLIYQFRVQRIRLKRLDGKQSTLSSEVIGGNGPILWPRSAKASFPEDLGDKRVDRVTVSLEGKTKLDGGPGEYLFVLPTSLTEANESVLKKMRGSFPKKIQFVHGTPAPARTAHSER